MSNKQLMQDYRYNNTTVPIESQQTYSVGLCMLENTDVINEGDPAKSQTYQMILKIISVLEAD